MRIIFIIYYLLITLLFVSCQESSSVEVEREKIASLLQKGDSCRQVGNEENSIAFYYRSLELAKQTGEQSLLVIVSELFIYIVNFIMMHSIYFGKVRRFMH